MEQHVSVGDNRTTRARHPEMYESMEKGTKEFVPTSEGEGNELIREERVAWSKESEALGHVPPMGEELPKEMVELVDKLGERLAFERTGTRLYDALLAKHDAYGAFDGGPSRSELEDIRREEHEHFLMLEQVISQLGGDPAALTPSADLASTVSSGVVQAVNDPRVNLLQGLEAILVAELTDQASWSSLIEIAKRAGKSELEKPFTRAYQSEEEHVEKVRRWVKAGHGVS